MEFIKKSLKNIINSTQNGANAIQLIYALIICWWGFGGLIGFDFMLAYLNYLTTPIMSIALICLSILGFAGISLEKYFLSFIFGFCNLFLFASVSLAYMKNAPTSMSSGTYFVLMLSSILLLDRIHRKQKANSKYKYDSID